MYVLAVLLTPVAVVMLILLLLLRASQPQAPIIIVHLHCTCSQLVQEEPDDEQDEGYWHTPVQETQHASTIIMWFENLKTAVLLLMSFYCHFKFFIYV